MKKRLGLSNLFAKKKKLLSKNYCDFVDKDRYNHLDGIKKNQKRIPIKFYSSFSLIDLIQKNKEKKFYLRAISYTTAIMLVFSLFNFASANIELKKTASVPQNIVKDEIIVKYKTKEATAFTVFDKNIKAVSKEKAFDEVTIAQTRDIYPKRSARVESVSKESKSLGNIVKVKLKPGTDIAKAIAEYKLDPNVEYATYNYKYKATMVLNDPLISDNLYPQWNVGKINLPQALDQSTGNENNLIAIIDTGINGQHEDFLDGNGISKVVAGYDFPIWVHIDDPTPTAYSSLYEENFDPLAEP